jgi:uncharacterized protein (TIGR02231 family)
MKEIVLFLFIILCVYNTFSQSIETDFPANEVVFYPKGALIKCSNDIILNKGQNTISISNLPVCLELGSVNFWTDNDFILNGLDFKISYKNIELSKKYSDSIEILDKQMLQIQKLNLIFENQTKDIENTNSYISRTDKAMEPGERIKWIDYIQNKRTEMLFKTDSLNARYLKLEDLKNLYKNKLIEISRGRLDIQVSVKNNASYKFHLTYIVPNAHWEPIFEINYDENKYTIEIQKKARIFNNMGLPLQNVKTFVSANYSNSKFDRPLMFPQYYSYNNPKESVYSSPEINISYALQSRAGSISKYQEKSKEDNEEASSSSQFNNFVNEVNKEIANVKVDSSKFKDLSFQNNVSTFEQEIGEISIKNEQKLDFPVHSEKISPVISKTLIPCKDKKTYVLARLLRKNYFLKDTGSIKLYKNHQYAGEAGYFTDAMSDSVYIPLCTDDLITSEYIESNESSSQKLFGKYKFETKSHIIAIKNHHDYSVNIDLFDQIPLGYGSIETKIINTSNGNFYSVNGKIQWTLTLKPKEMKLLHVVYAVKYLKSNNLYISKEHP